MSVPTTATSSDLELTAAQFDALIRAFEQISASAAEAIAILDRDSTERTPASGAVAVHGITVEHVQMPAGRPFRASCLCGWASPIVGARSHAAAAGSEHVAGTVGRGE